ncbi:MAG: hypothetical protein IT379_31450 [Deltaproteobacteria bacterium]|nr:hypothetical protein [Deltaproteobacteria bacterium]
MTDVLRQLAYDHLRHDNVRFPPKIEQKTLQVAALTFGVGLDHLEGERVIAVLDESVYAKTAGAIMSVFNDRLDCEYFGGLVVTDRHLVGGDPPEAVPLDRITGARVTGSVFRKLEVLGQTRNKSYVLESDKEVAAFVNALVQYPPHARVAAPRALVAPTADDPTGVLAEMNELGAGDARAVQLMALPAALRSRVAAVTSDLALDLASRAVLYARTLNAGRAMKNGLWISALPGPDLLAVLGRMLGRPVYQQPDPQGSLEVRFHWDGSVAKALLDSAVGLTVLAVAGVGWTMWPERSVISWRLTPFGPFTGFQLKAITGQRGNPFDQGEDLKLRQLMHDTLQVHEGRALLLRMIFGWGAPLEQLFQSQQADVAAKMQELVGYSDLSAFFPGQKVDKSHDGLRPDIQAAVDAAIRAEQQKTPEQRNAAARSAWQKAVASGTLDAMEDAALSLQHAQLYDDAIRAYQHILERFPEEGASTARSLGDCHLFQALYAPSGPTPAHLPTLDTALRWYAHAVERGAATEHVEENFWEACRALSEVAPAEQRAQFLLYYRSSYPAGAHRPDADARLAKLGVR